MQKSIKTKLDILDIRRNRWGSISRDYLIYKEKHGSIPTNSVFSRLQTELVHTFKSDAYYKFSLKQMIDIYLGYEEKY